MKLIFQDISALHLKSSSIDSNTDGFIHPVLTNLFAEGFHTVYAIGMTISILGNLQLPWSSLVIFMVRRTLRWAKVFGLVDEGGNRRA